MILSRLIGRREKDPSAEFTVSKMPGFDREFYLAHNPDVAASGVDPLGHYLQYGWREGREPSAGFAGQRYLALNPDVQAAGINPLVHYVNYGLAEGRFGAKSISGSSLIIEKATETHECSTVELKSVSNDSDSQYNQTRLL